MDIERNSDIGLPVLLLGLIIGAIYGLLLFFNFRSAYDEEDLRRFSWFIFSGISLGMLYSVVLENRMKLKWAIYPVVLLLFAVHLLFLYYAKCFVFDLIR